MFNFDFATYLGKEKEGGFSGYIAESNFFIVIEIEEGINAEQGKEILQKIKEEIISLSIQNLASFDQFISRFITKYNLPPSISLASGCLKDKIMYLKTIGEGSIYLNRNNNFAQIIEKDKSASGFLELGDFFVLTTQKFINVLGSDIELKTIFDNRNPQEIVNDLVTQLSGKGDDGAIALLVQHKEDEAEQVRFIDIESQQKDSALNQIKDKGRDFFTTFKELSQRSGKRKIFTLAAVVAILFILIWSVVLGTQRKNLAAANKKVKLTKELVSLKLDQAEEVAFLNLPRSMALLSEAKKEVDKLKKETGKQKESDVKELEQMIKATENKIVKKEDKNYEEFYDLTLDSKGARGSNLYLEKENLNIVDQEKGIVYTLSLSKKSLDKKSASEIKNAKRVASYQDYILIFVDGEGVYKISADGKSKRVIDKDKDWENIVDMWIYNGNLYLLDSGNGDIYKYLVAESGYSEKSSYLKGEAGSVKGANSIAIDSSVYIGLEDQIVKYTAGAKDDFSTSWPEKNVNLTKIFTSSDVEKVYGWDKAKGAVYILGKNGTYERQINSTILSKASDFVVLNNTAYVLVGEKIYKIALD